MAARETEGKNAAPTIVIVDNQSVKTTEAGGPRGDDAGKKIKGRKRHIAVDTLGLPIKYHVTTADVQDRDALPDLLKAVSQKSPWVELAFVDGGYAGDETQRAAFEASRMRLSVFKRSDRQIEGFIVLPKRWIVERTFGWVNRARRLARTSNLARLFAGLVHAGPGFPAHPQDCQGLRGRSMNRVGL